MVEAEAAIPGGIPREIEREFAAAAAGERVVDDVPRPGEVGPEPAHSPDDWTTEVHTAMRVVQAQMPAWRWEPGALDLIESGLCGALDKLAPGGLQAIESWGPYVQLVAGLAIVGVTNYDFARRRFRPWRGSETQDVGRRHVDGHSRRESAGEDSGVRGDDPSGRAAAGVGSKGDVAAGSAVPAGFGAG